jgi:hypothetical protein
MPEDPSKKTSITSIVFEKAIIPAMLVILGFAASTVLEYVK